MSRALETSLTALVVSGILFVAAPAAAQQEMEKDLSDPEVAHIAVTANSIDVELARLAKKRTDNPKVERFAETMISDHTAVNEQAKQLAQRLGVTPADNAVSRSLQDGAEQARSRLSGLEGQAFDRAYIEREVQYHQAVIDALDNVLIPTTDNGELKELLKQVRPALVAHLEHAKQIQQSLTATR